MNASEIRTKIKSLGSDDKDFFGGDFDGGIYLQQNPEEYSKFIEFLLGLNIKFSVFLEIGSASGGNIFVLNSFFDFDQIVIIDDNRHKQAIHRPEILKGLPVEEWIGDSTSVKAKDFLDELDIRFDLVFVDANHEYEFAKSDYQLGFKHLRVGGLLVMHDSYYCEGVKKFVGELDKELRIKKIFQISSVFGITVYKKLAPLPC